VRAKIPSSYDSRQTRRMLDWYGELGTAERRTFWACFGGWALDALDVQTLPISVTQLAGERIFLSSPSARC
jgi:hypothetical protein